MFFYFIGFIFTEANLYIRLINIKHIKEYVEKSWLKEIARDLLALGSIPFYFLVVIRVLILKDKIFIYQLAMAAISIFVLYFIIKEANLHIARSFVVLVFVNLVYKETIFGIFSVLIWIFVLISARYLKKSTSSIFRGIVIGIASSLAGYYIAPFF